jgi:hypothetical protein
MSGGAVDNRACNGWAQLSLGQPKGISHQLQAVRSEIVDRAIRFRRLANQAHDPADEFGFTLSVGDAIVWVSGR